MLITGHAGDEEIGWILQVQENLENQMTRAVLYPLAQP